MKLDNNSIVFYPQANNFSCPKAPECFGQNVCENNNLLTSIVTTFLPLLLSHTLEISLNIADQFLLHVSNCGPGHKLLHVAPTSHYVHIIENAKFLACQCLLFLALSVLTLLKNWKLSCYFSHL